MGPYTKVIAPYDTTQYITLTSLNRLCCSYPLWSLHGTWGKIIHAAFPFKLLIGQMVWKFFGGLFNNFVVFVRNEIIELECSILEKTVPITIGKDLYDDDDDDDDGQEEDYIDGDDDEEEEEIDDDSDDFE